MLAFIRERQSDVLAEAIDSLTTSTHDDLPQVIHAAYGTVGSYRLDAAHAAISDLAAIVSDPQSTGADIEAARVVTVDALRRIGDELTP